MIPHEIEQPTDVRTTTKRRAKYSNRDWIAWTDRDGVMRAAVASADSVKSAMLAVGTQGQFTLYERRTGSAQQVFWWMANNIRRQLKRCPQ